MLTVKENSRRQGLGRKLVVEAIERMKDFGCETIMLETEISNEKSIRLYEQLGFIREEYLVAYYLNWGDAYRLRLHFDDEEK